VLCTVYFTTGSSQNMTLAMSCSNDDDSNQSIRPLNWLEVKKAEKARSLTKPSDREKLTKELDEYLNEPNEPEDSNPYLWWNSNQAKYPTIAQVARAHLGIQATSVASERLFSKCGLVVSDRRASLSAQHVEQIVFLSHNM
jgi:hypothetical protein